MKLGKYIALILALGSVKAGAQDLPYFSPNPATLILRYGVGIPTGGLQQQVNNTSYNGWDAALLFHIGPHFSLGPEVEYNDFYEKYPMAEYNYGASNSQISAVVSNSIQNAPILLKGTWQFLSPTAAIRPYVGAGVGVNLVTYRQFLGEFGNYNFSRGEPAVNTEVGVNIPLTRNRRFGLNLAGQFNYLPFDEIGIANLNEFELKGGFYIPL